MESNLYLCLEIKEVSNKEITLSLHNYNLHQKKKKNIEYIKPWFEGKTYEMR